MPYFGVFPINCISDVDFRNLYQVVHYGIECKAGRCMNVEFCTDIAAMGCHRVAVDCADHPRYGVSGVMYVITVHSGSGKRQIITYMTAFVG